MSTVKKNTPERVVVKIGTSTLTGGARRLSQARMADLTRQVAEILERNIQVAIVSSGAIAAGSEALDFPDMPDYMPKKQMLAALGQLRLMAIYERLFSIYDKKVAQVLLTRTDLTDRSRYLNARNTLEALLGLHYVVPIINENDTVATEEIRFGDNDQLSAQVANLIEADKLIILTDQDGLYTSDPRKDSSAKLIREVTETEIPDSYWAAAGASVTGIGTGGMVTKLKAADLARRSGTEVFVCRGNLENVLIKILAGDNPGTHFVSTYSKIEGRKRFLLTGVQSTGMILVDAGASRAIRKGGSLLPVGIVDIYGGFERGDAIRISLKEGRPFAIGITNYSSKDLIQVKGLNSSQIRSMLGFSDGDEAVHHNNLIVI